MLVKKYRSEIVSIQSKIEGIYTLEFRSLSGKYKYHPGQFLHLSIEHDYDGLGQWPISRCFSMQSNPSSENIKITFAVKGLFTKQMESMLLAGSVVWIKLPYGDLFTKPHNKINTVFIAGGTGITPFLSLFTHPSFIEYINPRIYLGFKSADYNIYKTELEFVKTCDPDICYENVDGIMNVSRIFAENGTDRCYFLSGPPAMIKVFKNTLIMMKVPACQVLTDEWE
jgi:ferredoxin-NADP reductase